MATHPLANKSNVVSGTIQLPVLQPLPDLEPLVRAQGLMPGLKSWDAARHVVEQANNDALSKFLNAVKTDGGA